MSEVEVFDFTKVALEKDTAVKEKQKKIGRIVTFSIVNNYFLPLTAKDFSDTLRITFYLKGTKIEKVKAKFKKYPLLLNFSCLLYEGDKLPTISRRLKMEKILNKEENKLGVDVFIDGNIIFDLIPKEVMNNIVAELERDVSKKYEKKNGKKFV